MSKIKFDTKIIFLFVIISLVSSSQFTTNLWNLELIGKPYSFKFVSENEILTTSTRGVVSKVNASNGEIMWKKNMFYRNEIDLISNAHYSLLVNKNSNYLELINNESSQLLWSASLTYNYEDKLLKAELINEQKNFVGVVVQTKIIKIFNKEKIISDILARENEEFLDYFIDPEKEILHFVTLVDKKLVEINEVNLHKTAPKTLKKIAQVDIPSHLDIVNSFITRSFCILISSSGDYIIFNTKQKSQHVEGKLEQPFDNLHFLKFNFRDLIIFIIDSRVNILSLDNNNIQSLTDKEWVDIEYYDKVDSNQNSALYFINKQSANTFYYFNINFSNHINYDVKLISYFNTDDKVEIKQILVNPFNEDKFLIQSKDNSLFLFDTNIHTPLNKIDQSLSEISFIELVGYYNEQGKQNQNIHYHNNLSNIFEQKELSNILSNIIKGISGDLFEVGTRIKTNLMNLLENKKSSVAELNKKTKHYLIIFNEDSGDLHILNASNGSIISHRQMKNRTVLKVIRNTNEDINKNDNKFIYIMTKDKISGIYTSLRFDLETTELNEELTYTNDFIFEEEIKTQVEYLVNDNAKSSITLNGKLSKSILDKYENKYSVEVRDDNIYGIKYRKSNNKLDLSIAWNLMMNPFKIVQDKTPNIHANLITTYHVAGKVFYKYIDANILLVLSNIDNKTLLVTLLKANSGKILHQSYIQNVDFTQKILSVFEENIVLVSYMKKERSVLRNEIYAIEIMKREIEHSFVSMLEKIFKFNISGDNETKEEEHSESLHESDLIFLTQTYVLGRRLKGLFSSKTMLNVANKFFIFLFENNQVFLLDKRFVSPRRPLFSEERGKPGAVFDPLNSPYVDPELTPYNAVLTLDYKQMMNLNFNEDQIDKILVVPTQYESTFLICTEGLNLSCFNVYPDKTFDTLDVSFSYSLIAFFVVGIISLTYLLRKYVKKTEFKAKFISS